MKNIFLRSLFLLAIAGSVSSCAQNNKDATAMQGGLLTASEFQSRMNLSTDRQVIDVRTPEEFNGGHLKDAKNINIYDADFAEQLNSLDKTKAVFVYCKGGGRSAKAAEQMKRAGFSTIYDLKEGYMSWTNNEMPVETNAASSAADKFTADDFQKLITRNKLLLIDYYADWCAPCKQMAPVLEKLSREYEGKITIQQINVDDASAVTKQLKIEGIPVVSIYKSGTELKRVNGLQSESDLRALLALLQ